MAIWKHSCGGWPGMWKYRDGFSPGVVKRVEPVAFDPGVDYAIHLGLGFMTRTWPA
jgi:hypothetical protein